jgi:hypothetical protein
MFVASGILSMVLTVSQKGFPEFMQGLSHEMDWIF